MPFTAILKELVESVRNAEGAILLDWEGEAVQHYAVIPDYDIKFTGAHMGIILYRIRKSLDEVQDSNVKGISVRLDEKNILIYPVDKDYFIVLIISADYITGLVKRDIMHAVNAIRSQI